MSEATDVLHPELPAPRYLRDSCAARRAGSSGCRACADVCPHGALQFMNAGPEIDPNACERCGACTAACPLGALERANLPDEELFARVAAAAATKPAVLVLTCGHDSSAASGADGEGIRVVLPWVQLVSDDLLLLAVARGARSVVVEPSPSCPHTPHLQPARAVEAAHAVLESRGWDGSRVAIAGSGSRPEPWRGRRLERLLSTEPRGLRYERRIALLAALTEGERSPRATAVAAAVPWRRIVVDEQACTTCGACAFACPTRALSLGDAGTALYGREAACIGCELCAHACPESAITLLPTVPASLEPRLLARSKAGSCHACGGALLPEPLVHRVEGTLARRQGTRHVTVRLCEGCKGTRLLEPVSPAPPQPELRGPEREVPAILPGERSAHREPPSSVGHSRRSFFQTAATAAAGAIAMAADSGRAEDGRRDHRYGMVIDTRRCVGCNACVVACKAENKTPPGVNYMLVTNNVFGERPDDKPLFTAKPCFHCERPSCVDVCPVSATFKREQDGIVVVDYDRCIGCRYCQTACPYGARYFDFGENYAAETADGPYRPPSPEYDQFRARTDEASPIGTVRKCTFCMHLQDEKCEYDRAAGRWPACEGDEVRVESRHGAVRARVAVSKRIHPEVVGLQHGFGHTALGHRAKGRGTSDASLRPARADRLSGMALHKEACVRIRPV